MHIAPKLRYETKTSKKIPQVDWNTQQVQIYGPAIQ